jgi:hypothetical protein
MKLFSKAVVGCLFLLWSGALHAQAPFYFYGKRS